MKNHVEGRSSPLTARYFDISLGKTLESSTKSIALNLYNLKRILIKIQKSMQLK